MNATKMAKHARVRFSFAIALGSLIWGRFSLAEDKPVDAAAKPIHWIDLTHIGIHVSGMKKEIVLDAETAAKIFAKNRRLHDGWEKHVPARIENAADATTVSDELKKVWIPSSNYLHADVVKYSEKELIVHILQHQGNYLAGQFEECKGNFRIRRGKEVDGLFGMEGLKKFYGAEYQGLKHGDREEDVLKKLGKPDKRIDHQLVGHHELCYSTDRVTIAIKHGRIQSISKHDADEKSHDPLVK